jgi:hypothetical protein
LRQAEATFGTGRTAQPPGHGCADVEPIVPDVVPADLVG